MQARDPPVQNGSERSPAEGRLRRQIQCVQHGGRHIQQIHQTIPTQAGPTDRRAVQDEGDPQLRLPGKLAVSGDPVFEEHLSVVAEHDQQRILPRASPRQFVYQQAQLLVLVSNASVIQIDDLSQIRPVSDPPIGPARAVDAAPVIRIHVDVVACRLTERLVRIDGPEQEKKRRRGIRAAVEPFQGPDMHVFREGQAVVIAARVLAAVTAALHRPFVLEQIAEHVKTPVKATELADLVNGAKSGGLEAKPPEDFRQPRNGRVQRVPHPVYARGGRILAREDAGAGRGCPPALRVAARECGPLLDESVEHGRRPARISISVDMVRPKRIHGIEKHIHRWYPCLSGADFHETATERSRVSDTPSRVNAAERMLRD